jgi:hypothetical protein
MFENEELKPKDLQKIARIKDALEKIVGEIHEPLDPKIIALLEMSIDMLEEQVILDKKYTYDDDCPACQADSKEPDCQLKFFDEDDSPSAEELLWQAAL